MVPVPFAEPDPDVALDLGLAIQRVYDLAAYHLRIDYHAPPPPPALLQEDLSWLRSRFPC